MAQAGDVSDAPRGTISTSAPKKARRRFRQSIPLKDRLNSFAIELREKAAGRPGGSERESLLKRALSETTSDLDDWANSPGLKPPD